MAVPVLHAAKFVAELTGWTSTNLELQKTLYFAHMYHLGVHGRPLVQGDFEAWGMGPVHPTLYRHVKHFASGSITEINCSGQIEEGGSESAILKQAVAEFSGVPVSMLITLTHRQGGAWSRNYDPERNHVRIPEIHVVEEYRRWIGMPEDYVSMTFDTQREDADDLRDAEEADRRYKSGELEVVPYRSPENDL